MKSTPEFYKRLCRQRSLLLLAVVCWFALIVSGIGAFGVLLLEGVNSSKPLQEQNVFYVVVGLAFLLVGLFAVGIVIILRRRPTVVALTRVIEERFPDFGRGLGWASLLCDSIGSSAKSGFLLSGAWGWYCGGTRECRVTHWCGLGD